MPSGLTAAMPFFTPCKRPRSSVKKLVCKETVLPITLAGSQLYFLNLLSESLYTESVTICMLESGTEIFDRSKFRRRAFSSANC